MAKELKKFNDATSNLFVETIKALAEGATGIATSSKNDLIFSASSIFQRLRSGSFLSLLLNEWNKYRAKGRIKDDYIETEQHQACLGELLVSLEKDMLDELRFSVLKQIFLVASEEKVSNRNDVMPLQYMKIARTLSDGEVLILNSCFAASQKDFWKTDDDRYDWHGYIKKETGMPFRDLIEIHVRNLEDKKLIWPPKYPDRSGLVIKPYFRLTELGYHFCQFINTYEKET